MVAVSVHKSLTIDSKCIFLTNSSFLYNYHLQMKFWEGNIFTGMYLLIGGGGDT